MRTDPELLTSDHPTSDSFRTRDFSFLVAPQPWRRRIRFSAFTLLPDKIANGGYDLTVSASEIIQELPKLSDAERQAVLDKLRELAQVDDDRWDEIVNKPTPRPKLQVFMEQPKAVSHSI